MAIEEIVKTASLVTGQHTTNIGVKTIRNVMKEAPIREKTILPIANYNTKRNKLISSSQEM